MRESQVANIRRAQEKRCPSTGVRTRKESWPYMVCSRLCHTGEASQWKSRCVFEYLSSTHNRPHVTMSMKLISDQRYAFVSVEVCRRVAESGRCDRTAFRLSSVVS